MTTNKDLLPALRKLLVEWKKKMKAIDNRIRSNDYEEGMWEGLDCCIRDIEQIIKDGEK